MITTENAFWDMVVFIFPIVLLINLLRKKTITEHLVIIITTIYLFGLIAVTIFPVPIDSKIMVEYKKQGFGASINFVPFRSIMGSLNHSYFMVGLRNVLGNLLLLLPFGILIGYKRLNKSMIINIGIGLASSIVIELAQWVLTDRYFIFPRSVDIDDLILNTIGFTFGYLIYMVANKIFKNTRKTRILRGISRGH
ncbi:hypothetical protein PASE110613_17825 [Paenibacillus sediminis]|uniref:VanZ family protein n=1 Tax=Paenibacillus sediminis TaxID=664909 RepID=UPI0039E90B80